MDSPWQCSDIMYNVDQQLFESCTAKFSDNTQCCIPVFDIKHELPLCPEHAAKAVSNFNFYTLLPLSLLILPPIYCQYFVLPYSDIVYGIQINQKKIQKKKHINIEQWYKVWFGSQFTTFWNRKLHHSKICVHSILMALFFRIITIKIQSLVQRSLGRKQSHQH